jgi:hypothetical protein
MTPDLPQGKRVTVEWATEMDVYGYYWEELEPLSLEKIRILAVDAFNGRHEISVRHGEVLERR